MPIASIRALAEPPRTALAEQLADRVVVRNGVADVLGAAHASTTRLAGIFTWTAEADDRYRGMTLIAANAATGAELDPGGMSLIAVGASNVDACAAGASDTSEMTLLASSSTAGELAASTESPAEITNSASSIAVGIGSRMASTGTAGSTTTSAGSAASSNVQLTKPNAARGSSRAKATRHDVGPAIAGATASGSAHTSRTRSGVPGGVSATGRTKAS